MDDVYCSNCKYCAARMINGSAEYICLYKDYTEDTSNQYREHNFGYGSIEFRNKENNCKWFEASLWYKLKRLFK